MADKAHILTDEKLEEMEKRLYAIYSRAEKGIGERWKEYLVEAQAEIDELQKAYDLAKKGGDQKEIRKSGRKLSKAKRDRTLMNNRFKDLTERTAAELANVNKTALAYINRQLPEVYSINYNVLAPRVDGVGGYSFALVDADTVKNLATTDKSLLPYKELDKKKDIRWNVKKMNAEVLQGILQGEPMDRIARRLSKVVGMNETAAIRNARTMVTGAENKGRQDSYARAEADGIILQKEWLATNDGRVRHSHAMLDGAIVDQDKKFDNGLMYPGDPSGRPEEVYNCRCTLVAKVNGFKKVQVQKAMAEKQVEEPKLQKPIEYQNPTSEDYSNLGKASRKNVSKEDQEQIFKHDGGGYVATHNYSTINSNLRKDGYAGNPLTDDDKKTISALDRAISKTQTDKDYVFTRYVNADYLTSQFGVYQTGFHGEQETISNMILEFRNTKKQVPRITQELQKLIGTDDIDPAFLSTSMLPDKNIMKSKSVLIKIKAPKGTDVYVPKNRKESECIFGRGVKRTIESVEFDEQQNKWIITEVISIG